MKTAWDSPFLDAETGIGEAGDEAPASWRTLRPGSPYVQGEIDPHDALPEEERGVIDGEDRRRVADPLAVPFRWICSISVSRLITRASGGTSRAGLAPAGSGVLISPRHVLTAAHVLHGSRHDSSVAERHEAQTVRVRFGPSGNEALTEVEADRWDWPRRQWKPDGGRSAFDFALITLGRPVGEQVFQALGNRALNYWGHAADHSLDRLPAALAARLLHARVYTAGYPHSGEGSMMCSTGVLSTGSAAHDAVLRTPAAVEQWARKGTLFSMTADATPGQSGSPVWVVDRGRRYIVGIAVTAGNAFNRVRAIDAFLLRCLDAWMGAGGRSREIDEEEDGGTWPQPADPRIGPDRTAYHGEAREGPGVRGLVSDPDPASYGESAVEADDEHPSASDRDDDGAHDGEGTAGASCGVGRSEDDGRSDRHAADFAPVLEAEDDVFEHDAGEVSRLLAAADWDGAVRAAIAAGERDESRLANLLFFARHPGLDPTRPLSPKAGVADAKLAAEWREIGRRHVWPQIVAAARDPVLAVHGKQVASLLRHFRGSAGRRFRQLVEAAAQKVGLNPGLLAAALIGETGTNADYLTAAKVGSYRTGVDDFYAMRGVLARTVPAYAQVGWDRKQQPVLHPNDAQKNPREVQSIWFDSGADALLATAVYLKYGEVRLREEAAKRGGDFDALPVETRFALVRMSMAAGRAGAATRLVKALEGKDILVRDWTPPKIYRTNRNATIRAAEAMFLSGWIFGQPLAATPVAQPEGESFPGPDDDEAGADRAAAPGSPFDEAGSVGDRLEAGEHEAGLFEDGEFGQDGFEDDAPRGDEFRDDEAPPDATADAARGGGAEALDFAEADAEADDEVDDGANDEVDDAADDERSAALERRELDPALVDLAERTMARETSSVEQEVAARWTTCFSAADVARTRQAYEDNVAAARATDVDRCSCIVMLNVGLGQLLNLGLKEHRARGTSERRVQMANLTTETIEKAMAQLRRRGFAVGPTRIDFHDRRSRTAGTLKPERLQASVRGRVLAASRKRGCWFAFGLSILDGYHSVLLLVDRSAAEARIFWLDQFSDGLSRDVTDSLDRELTDSTQTFWQRAMDERGKGYDTMIRLWQLRRPATSGAG